MAGSSSVEKHSATPGGADNKAKYEKLDGVTTQDVAQLLKLDKEITRLFEVQMRKRNKNDEMIRNKINDLNDKPSLRNFLFKKVSDNQMQKDIVALKTEVERLYKIEV
jgi:hypothetical protein